MNFNIKVIQSQFEKGTRNDGNIDMEINGNVKLYRFADIILKSFKFKNDHYSFFTNNVKDYENGTKIYASVGVKKDIFEDFKGENWTEFSVNDLLENETEVIFYFDFGDEWIFTIRKVKESLKDGKESLKDGKEFNILGMNNKDRIYKQYD